ncbi:MAG: FAD-binding oxidoreductase [Acidimicrobiales bacterium]
MPTPLASGYEPSVLWQATAAPHRVAPSDLPERADVVVVGGGYCGLSAATQLVGAGRTVVALDAHDLGWGASTRNGGMVLPELKEGPRTLEQRHGALGLQLHAEVEAAFDHVERVITEGSIECAYARTGQLYLSHGERASAHLDALAAELMSVGSSAHVVRGDDLRAEIGSPLFAAGLVVERSGGLHPARFHAGLARLADRAGVWLHPDTPATSVTRDGDAWLVRTPRGDVRTRDVLVATNAYADALVPALRRRVLPMGSFIIATEPLAPDLAAAVLPTGRMCFNDRNLLWYWRLDDAGRMVFGGRKRLGRVPLDAARDHLYDAMVEVHPQLAGVRVERAWGGQVALTLDRLPHCGRIDGLWYATGCNGSGVALNTWLGVRMAAAIVGEPLPPFAELAHRPIPLHRLRAAWLPMVSAWFRIQDRRAAA